LTVSRNAWLECACTEFKGTRWKGWNLQVMEFAGTNGRHGICRYWKITVHPPSYNPTLVVRPIVIESWRKRKRVKVSHPNLFTFMKHIQDVSTQHRRQSGNWATDQFQTNQTFSQKCYLLNDKRIQDLSLKYLSRGNRYEFLAAVSHVCDNLSNTALHADDSCSDDETDVYYTDSESASSSTDVVESASSAADAQPQQLKTTCDVCLIAERDAVALVPCGHARFCRRCCNELVLHNHHCPLCRASISMVLDLYIEWTCFYITGCFTAFIKTLLYS